VALFTIDRIAIYSRELQPRAIGLIIEWATQHRTELVAAVEPLPKYRLHLRFDDGTEGESMFDQRYRSRESSNRSWMRRVSKSASERRDRYERLAEWHRSRSGRTLRSDLGAGHL